MVRVRLSLRAQLAVLLLTACGETDSHAGRATTPAPPPPPAPASATTGAPPADPGPPVFSLPADEDLVATPSGLRYQVLELGAGIKPKATDSVLVRFTGWLATGTVIDSSPKTGEPATLAVNQVIKGLGEGLQLMAAGSTYTFVIPADLAWGASGSGLVPPRATVVFQVELIKLLP